MLQLLRSAFVACAGTMIMNIAAAQSASGLPVPANQSANKACVNASGQTKAECEKVAHQIDANSTKPEPAAAKRPHDPEAVEHSGPAMDTAKDAKAVKHTKANLPHDSAAAPKQSDAPAKSNSPQSDAQTPK